MRRLGSLVLVFLTTFCNAQEIEVIQKVKPKPFAISHNIVFVIDASSTINTIENAQTKFNKGWDIICNQFASDELYFRAYIFHDKWGEKRTKWIDAGGPLGFRQFIRVKKWVLNNTGTFSFGSRALRMAFREKNPMDKNPGTNSRLTIVILTDGGFTEAADGGNDEEKILKSSLKKHFYGKTGSFSVYSKLIEQEQAYRKKIGLAPASIVAIGLENKTADKHYGNGVKRRDPECQAWLQKIGKKYGGGYYLVRNKEKTRQSKRVS